MRNQLRIPFLCVALFCGVEGVIAQCTPDSVLYSYTGSTQTFTVPSCVTTITVKAWGAAGAGGGTDCDGGGSGGGGAYSSSTITVVPSEVLTIVIGGGGKPGANNKAGVGAGAGGYGYGNGGEGGEPGDENPGGTSGAGAGGGGGTAVVSGVTPLLVAGGGGGGAGGGCSSVGGGGGGGGQNGFSGTGPGGAAGGSSSTTGVIGSSGTWDCGGAGGGGGGLNGGDSGHVTECDCGAGGGGGGNCFGTIIINGNGATPGYNTYPGLPAGYALGGAPNVGAAGLGGGNGYMIIEYCVASGVSASVNYTSPSCFGSDDGTATANPSGGTLPYTYLWNPSSQTNQTATGLSAGSYTVTVNDATGCIATASVIVTQPAAVNVVATSVPADSACAGQRVTLNASGATSYLWSAGGGTSSSITVVIPAGDTAYYGVKGTVNGCVDSVALKIKIIPIVSATIAQSVDSICPGQTSTLTVTASGGQATYSWSPGGATSSSIPVSPTTTTTYTATITGLCNTFQRMITVTYVPLPVPVITGTSWKCKGVKDTLTVSSSNGATRYVWSNGSTKTSIITGSIDADSTITVTAYNALGCNKDTTFKITLRAPPTVIIPLPAVVCGGSPVVLTANATGTGPFSYVWSPPGTGNTSSVTVSPDSATIYTVTVSNGCITTKTTTVLTGNPLIGACCSTTILKGNDTTMVATGDTSIESYMWTPSVTCLDPPLCDSVKATPTVTTTYTVIGTDRAGCQSERIVTITVETPCFNFIVPNVFTPNNAGTLGLDKVFYINTANTNITAWSILIVDRWGKEVYNSTNPTQYWDGNTQGGGQAPSGVYYYIINATCAGSTAKKDGFVQVIR